MVTILSRPKCVNEVQLVTSIRRVQFPNVITIRRHGSCRRGWYFDDDDNFLIAWTVIRMWSGKNDHVLLGLLIYCDDADDGDVLLMPVIALRPKPNDRDFAATFHYNDVIMSAMASQITSLTIVHWTVYSGEDQENIKAPRYWPLWGEFTGDRWIPHTKCQ